MINDDTHPNVVTESTSSESVPVGGDGSEQQPLALDDALEPLRALSADASDSEISHIVEALAKSTSDVVGVEKAILLGRVSNELQRLGVPKPAAVIKAALNPAIRDRPSCGDNSDGLFEDIEPWAASIDGGKLASSIVSAILAYVVVPDVAALATALWVLHAHAFDAAEISPNLVFWSPEKRCGKTTMLSLVAELVPRPLATANVTTASVYRTIAKHHPTLLIDEADTFIHNNSTLTGVLNSGHNRRIARVVRHVGSDAKIFSTWTPKAIALINKLPPTLEDRSISIALNRISPQDEVRRFREDRVAELHVIRGKVARWAADNLDALRNVDPVVPTSLNSRAADNWRPLLAIADRIGEPWATKARDAAVILSAQRDGDSSLAEMLLGDIRDFFNRRGAPRVRSRDLVAWLNAQTDRPWSEIRNGRPMTTNGLAQRLRAFRITPRMMQFGMVTTGAPPSRGYDFSQFEDAFRRYLSPAPVPETATPQQPLPDKAQSLVQGETEQHGVSGSGGPEPNNDGACFDVAPWEPEFQEVFDLTDGTFTGFAREDER